MASASALPMLGEAIDGMLESAEDVPQSLEQARSRPHVLDDYTLGRVREAHGTQLNDLWWYTERLARWHRASPTPAQQQELARLTDNSRPCAAFSQRAWRWRRHCRQAPSKKCWPRMTWNWPWRSCAASANPNADSCPPHGRVLR